MSAAEMLLILAAEGEPRLTYEGPATSATLIVPAGVTSMCFAAAAQGRNGQSTDGISQPSPALGGVSGAAAYINNVAVTPGETLSITVNTTEAAVRRGAVVLLRCDQANFDALPGVVGFPGTGGPSFGGSGGRGGGGSAGFTSSGGLGTDGGAPGGNGIFQSSDGQGGGGNGLVRSLANNGTSGAPGSGGTPGAVNAGGKYGGGGGGAGFVLGTPRAGGPGGVGAVIVIWGVGRSFPNNSD